MVVAIQAATDAGEFAAVAVHLGEMALWDGAECDALGCDGQLAIESFYGESAATLQAMFTAPDALMLLAIERGEVLGHAGFVRFDAGRAEVTKVWITPAARGRGLARRMMAQLCEAMPVAGYRGACLETTTFMAGAVRLYEQFGFRQCAPFRAPPAGFAPITIFMQAAF